MQKVSMDATEDQISYGIPPCPYCGEKSILLVSSTDINRKTTSQIFSFYQCSICSIVFLDPMPKDMTPFYEGGYQTIPQNLAELRKIAHKERYRMESILKHVQGGRLLEIGPWMGIFSCNAKDAGFNVTAIEMDQNCVNFLQDVLGIRAIQSNEPEKMLDAMNEKFDVVVLWHCLEHLPKPWLVLQKAAERLAPGGILLVAIPNIESYDFSALGARWLHLDVPRHLYQFPIRWLESVCLAAGLTTLETTTSDRLSKILSRDAWHAHAASKIPIRYIRWVLGRLFNFIAKANYKGQFAGGGLTAIFRKSS
jgi:2-polyprenyl-3-methyl-5-hydroxy-6-metoxy-1,4-benzoquinol methylase